MAEAPVETTPQPVLVEVRQLKLLIIVAAILITLALLLIANEIRFQGCRNLANEQVLSNAGFEQKCSRLPWGA